MVYKRCPRLLKLLWLIIKAIWNFGSTVEIHRGSLKPQAGPSKCLWINFTQAAGNFTQSISCSSEDQGSHPGILELLQSKSHQRRINVCMASSREGHNHCLHSVSDPVLLSHEHAGKVRGGGVQRSPHKDRCLSAPIRAFMDDLMVTTSVPGCRRILKGLELGKNGV